MGNIVVGVVKICPRILTGTKHNAEICHGKEDTSLRRREKIKVIVIIQICDGLLPSHPTKEVILSDKELITVV